MTNLFFCISQFSMNLFTISPNIALEATEQFNSMSKASTV